MKPKSSRASKKFLSWILLAAVAVPVILFSCKKSRESKSAPPEAETRAAILLKGQSFQGALQSQSSTGQWDLSLSSGQTFIIETLPQSPPLNIAGSEKVQVIRSDYGLLIHDLSGGKIYLLANNDPESLRKFRDLSAGFFPAIPVTPVFGTTLVNPEKF